MGKLNVAGIVYDNPRQTDQSLNIDPLTGKPWAIIDRYLTYGINTILGGTFADAQPGAFDATPLQTNPVVFNQTPVPASDPTVGGQRIPNSSVTFKNPS
jgi:hypothetical protein